MSLVPRKNELEKMSSIEELTLESLYSLIMNNRGGYPADRIYPDYIFNNSEFVSELVDLMLDKYKFKKEVPNGCLSFLYRSGEPEIADGYLFLFDYKSKIDFSVLNPESVVSLSENISYVVGSPVLCMYDGHNPNRMNKFSLYEDGVLKSQSRAGDISDYIDCSDALFNYENFHPKDIMRKNKKLVRKYSGLLNNESLK